MAELINDPVERIVADALTGAGIGFVHESERNKEAGVVAVDFWLPAFRICIECKQFHTPRTSEQLANWPEAIVIQGMAAAKVFAALINPKPLSDPAPASPDGGSTSDGTHAAATSAPSCTTTPAQARGAAAPATPERHGYRLPQDAGAELGAISPSTNSTPPAAPQGEAICKRLREYAAAQDRMAARTNEDITHWHHVGLCETLKKAADTIEALTAERTRADAAGFARGVEAAAKEVVQYRCDPNRNRDCYVQNATAVEIDKAIRSLSPPPQRESASDPLVEWLRDMRDHLKEGFMVCDRCGFDMSTKDMDVVDDIDAAINHATGAKALARRAPREGK